MPRRLKPEYMVQFWTSTEPAVPPGWRGIKVELVGRKWVKFRLTGTQDRVRVKKSVFDALKLHAVKRGKLTGQTLFGNEVKDFARQTA